MDVEIDRKDCQILEALMENGRMTNHELAGVVNLSPSPCLRRVRLLEERGVIAGYAAVVDQKSVGLALTAFVEIRLARHDRETVEAFEALVRHHREIVDCYLMSGESDYLLRVVVADFEGYERFVREVLHSVPGIGSIETGFAYGTVKQSRILPLPGRGSQYS